MSLQSKKLVFLGLVVYGLGGGIWTGIYFTAPEEKRGLLVGIAGVLFAISVPAFLLLIWLHRRFGERQ